MLRLNNLSIPLDASPEDLRFLVLQKLKIGPGDLKSLQISKKSVDARDKGDVHFVYALDVEVAREVEVVKRLRPQTAVILPERGESQPLPKPSFSRRPVVVGAGPAGLFSALILARAGARPLLIERGKRVHDRAADVSRLFEEGHLDPESNALFGEGGAGAFSDGKLTTGIKSHHCREVLETFVQCGAPEEILYHQKPHIGTDLLRGVVATLREEIEALGGEVWFETRLTGLNIEKGKLHGIRIARGQAERELDTDTLILAIGHSARDTYRMLHDAGIPLAQKPFSVGARIEHPQALINQSQYGRFANNPALGAADYKLSVRTPDGRGAYTFCMCPGGMVICAASQPDALSVNGMSYHKRDGNNANSALLIGIDPLDFGDSHPLAGLCFQQAMEKAAFRAGGGGFKAPVQRVEDFLLGRASTHLGSVIPSYLPGVTPADLQSCLPPMVIENMRLGIRQMDRQLQGFAHPDAVLTGVETRSSSPVRILRDEKRSSAIEGIFPAGEGSGYAGGIMSAAVDGISCAIAALERKLERKEANDSRSDL